MLLSGPFTALLLCTLLVQFGQGFPKGGQTNANTEREEILDSAGKYKLIWDKDFDTKTITFQVIVETLGFVGFGISPNGGMVGADIVIGGVGSNGEPYFTDRHGVGNVMPKIDDHADWELISATEDATHTTLKFKRFFDTCDTQDFIIGNDTSNLIWSFGATDDIVYHQSNRGSYSINLLDPAMPPFDPSTEKTWQIAVDYNIPDGEETIYWCTVHKSPPLESKHHAIGFEAYLPDDVAKAHTHHVILHECPLRDDFDVPAFLEPYVGNGGGHCFLSGNYSMVQGLCQPYLFVWAVGGRRTIFPDHVGFPLGESTESNFYMFEVHYNNPSKTAQTVRSGLNVFYTDNLRPNDAGTLTLGHGLGLTQFIPPGVDAFLTVGHCSPLCTAASVPSEGLNVFNVLLHSHLLGRKLKIRHFRDGNELEWLSYDDNYDFDFQQNRPLREETVILPGDQLEFECTYQSTARTGVTLGGLSTEEEMCQSFLAYYPRMRTRMCGSEFGVPDLLPYLGIDAVQFENGVSDLLVTAPPHHAGKRVTEVINAMDWTPNKVDQLQKILRYGAHRAICNGQSIPNHYISYMDVDKEYAPPNTCSAK